MSGMKDPTTVKALEWIQRDVMRLVGTIREVGKADETDEGRVHVSFGELWDAASDEYAALSATLVTAKKHGLVHFEAEHLLQGYSADEDIVLLVAEGEEAHVEDDRREGRLGTPTPDDDVDKIGNVPCAQCGDLVYRVERVEANGVLHKRCFVCSECNDPLTISAYGYLDSRWYCLPHYRQRFLVNADYERGFVVGDQPGTSSTVAADTTGTTGTTSTTDAAAASP